MMKKLFYSGCFFMAVSPLTAQINVFDCNLPVHNISQQEINATNVITGSCISLGQAGAVTIQDNAQKDIRAYTQIKLYDGTRIGAFSGQGNTHLEIINQTAENFGVAAMNYDDLNAIKRYKKFELGIQLPKDIAEYVRRFIQKTNDDYKLNPFVEWDLDVQAHFFHPATEKAITVDGFFTRDYLEMDSLTIDSLVDNHLMSFATADSFRDDWVDIDSVPTLAPKTDYPFRIRFAPPENGLWNCYITIKEKGAEKYASNIFEFNVVESGDPGYVKIHPNKRNFMRGGNIIYPVGQTFPMLSLFCLSWGGYCTSYQVLPDHVHVVDTDYGDTIYYGRNLFSYKNTEKVANIVAWKYYLDMVSQYLQDGGKYIRTTLMPTGGLIEFEEMGNYFRRLHQASEMDKLMDTLEKYDALLALNLMNQVILSQYDGYGMNQWDWGHYKYDPATQSYVIDSTDIYPAYGYNHHPYQYNPVYTMFTDTTDLAYHTQRLRYYAARYGYSTKIYDFEILSEPWHIDGFPIPGSDKAKEPYYPENADSTAQYYHERDAVYTYHKVMAHYLKTMGINQLVGMDMLGSTDNQRFDFQSITLPDIDVVGINYYDANPDDSYKVSMIVDNICQLRGSVVPVVQAEEGIMDPYRDCSNNALEAPDIMLRGFTKVGAYYHWYGYDRHLDFDYNTYWKHTIRTQYHLDGYDVISALSEGNGQWTQAKEEGEFTKEIDGKKYTDKFLENQYLVSQNKNFAVGYVKNRTFNIKSEAISPDCSELNFMSFNKHFNINWDDPDKNERLKVIKLGKKEKYSVDWYSIYKNQSDGYVSTNSCTKTKKIKIDGNNEWGIYLKYPQLGFDTTENGSPPVLWYVVKKCSANLQKLKTQSSDTTNGTNNSGIIVYPNPFNDFLKINVPKEEIASIYTIDGKFIKSFDLIKGENTINLKIEQGFYIIYFENERTTFKLIKP